MAQSSLPTPSHEPPYISLRPNEILLNVAHALNGRVDHLTSHINVDTTYTQALSHVQSTLKGHDLPLRLTQIPTSKQKKKLKELAISVDNSSPGPLSIRNSIPASQLPSPRRATHEHRNMLKENIPKSDSMSKPYVMNRASLEDKEITCNSCQNKSLCC